MSVDDAFLQVTISLLDQNLHAIFYMDRSLDIIVVIKSQLNLTASDNIIESIFRLFLLNFVIKQISKVIFKSDGNCSLLKT